ncbi:hypothetical protein PQQ63_15275 [Paraburkholderia metrosideri]|uniref:Uncharacterized protein n=1 Tax=Paraburkholderia metrosideri TaxID=580937 RepID=A0ABW9DTQ9_9BURK
MASILQLAGMLPRDPQFREWVSQYTVPPSEVTVDEAAEFIRIACGVDSRRQLTENAGAADAFHNFIRRPFVAWRDKQCQPQGAEA